MSQVAQNTVQEAGEDDGPPLLPLYLHMEGCATESEMNANVTATIERGYTRFNEYLGKFEGEAAIVGAGPSIKRTHKDLKGDVIAINSAIGYLLDQGTVPRWAMIWDASHLCAQFAIPHPDITYLIGARCHPSVFERLKDCKVICWHAGGDHNIAEFLVQKKLDEPMVNGGSAGVTRAMYLAVALGYRKLNIYGADSSYSDDGHTHINGSLVPEKDLMVWIGNGKGKKLFRTTPEWCAQVNEFRDIYAMFRHPNFGIEIEVYGEGMLPHMAELMKAKAAYGLIWNPDGTVHPSYKFDDGREPGPPPATQQLEEKPNVDARV